MVIIYIITHNGVHKKVLFKHHDAPFLQKGNFFFLHKTVEQRRNITLFHDDTISVFQDICFKWQLHILFMHVHAQMRRYNNKQQKYTKVYENTNQTFNVTLGNNNNIVYHAFVSPFVPYFSFLYFSMTQYIGFYFYLLLLLLPNCLQLFMTLFWLITTIQP